MANTFKFGNGNWAVKDGYALAYNDENNNFKPLPFDFTRASSATRVNKQGLVETVPSGKPRIDFLDNTSGHLLLEPSRTNYITQSIDLADWSSFVASGTVTRTNEYSTSPDGLNKATRLQMSGGSSVQWTYLNVSNSATYASFYVKSTGSSSQNFRWFWNNGSNGQDFTATTEWQRFEVAVSQSSTLPMGFTTHSDLSASDILVWGVQAEAGSYATSYIPTEGSSVTRVAETIEQDTFLMEGLTDMAMFVDYELPNDKNTSSARNQIGFRDNSTADFYLIQLSNTEQMEFRFRGTAGVNVDMTPTISEATYGLRRKILFTKTGTTLKAFCNGIEVSSTTNSNATTFSSTTESLHISNTYTKEFNIREWRLYNTGLTDQEAIALTTI